MDATAIVEGLHAVERRVAAACARAGRDRSAVTLLAVTKLQPTSAVLAAYQAGHRDFAENYAQELKAKAADPALSGARFHAIGALQTNKARVVAEHAAAFHALDRLDVARELHKRRPDTLPPLPCFIEVNIAGEATKHGVAADGVRALLNGCTGLSRIRVIGLMCMPPWTGRPDDSRPHFRALRQLASAHGLPQLSMGTTDDFEVGIAERATHVRVGRAIFGERPTG